jgi:hypothetical protein
MNFYNYLSIVLIASCGALGCYSRNQDASNQASKQSNNSSQGTVNVGSSEGLNKYGVKSWSSMSPSGSSKPIFSLVFQPDYQFQNIRDLISSQTDLPLLVNSLNDSQIKFQKPIEISFEPCPSQGPNAFWDEEYSKEKSKVVMCYELVAFLYKMRHENLRFLPPNMGLQRSLLLSVEFVLLHEVGHAIASLLSKLEIPVTGNSEDIADQFAAISSIHADRPDITFGGAYLQFDFSTLQQPVDPKDSHPPNATRAANLYCYLYGADPSKYSYLTPDYVLPNRAQTCIEEFKTFSKSWAKILSQVIEK